MGESFEKYIGCKIILAIPMTDVAFNDIRHIDNNPASPVDGYLVRYPDGYQSWSPKEVFETAYRKITDDELALLK